MSNIEVRWAVISDFPDLATLDRESWRDNRNSEFIPDGEHVWRVWIDHAYVGVALDDEKIVGVILSFPSTETDLHFIHKIFMQVEYRGIGIGKKLMRLVCGKFDANNISAYLTTDANNLAMQRLAEAVGFSERERVSGYYRQNEDRWLYKRIQV